MCTCKHVYTYMCIYSFTLSFWLFWIQTLVLTCICIHTCVYINMYIQICMWVYMCICKFCKYICLCIYIYLYVALSSMD